MSSVSDQHVVTKSKKPKNKAIQALTALFVWYPKNYTAEERKLLFKLDLSILVYGALSLFCKFLDQTNVNNAYVSGMKEDLSLYGNELNWLNVTYISGYVIGQVPFLLLQSRPSVSKYVLPTLEVFYSVATFSQSRIKTVNHLYAIRFIVGFFEAPSFAGVHYYLGAWYGSRSYRGNPPELYVRAGVFFASSSVGSMFSGYLQSAAYTNLSGHAGLEGWRWLFIIDGIITLPISIIGFIFWPGLPEGNGKPWFLTNADYEVVKKRLKRYGSAPVGKLDRAVFKRTFKNWQVYAFVFTYILMLLCYYPANYFSLWLKAQGVYTVPQINNYPTAINAISIFASVFGCCLASAYAPWKVFSIGAFGLIAFGIIMTIYNVPRGLVFFAFYASGLAGLSSPVFFSTLNKIMKHDQESRALIFGMTMGVGYAFYAFVPLRLYPTDTAKYGDQAAPRWKAGYPTSLALSALMGVSFVVIHYLDQRDRKANGERDNADEEEEEEGLFDEVSEEVELRVNDLDPSDNTAHDAKKENIKVSVHSV